MFNHELYAASLARAVDVMRNSDDKEQQKGHLRALVALSASASATIRCYDGHLSVDDIGIPAEVPHIGTLGARLAAHGIVEVAIGRGAEPAELLALIRGLAASASGQPMKDRLREAKSSRIMVLLRDGDDAAGRRPSVSQLFDPETPMAPAAPVARGKMTSARREEEEALAMWNDMHSASGGNSTMKEVDLGFTAETPLASIEPVVERPREPEPEPVVPIPIATDTPLGAALLALARRPFDAAVLDRLVVLENTVGPALAEGRLGDVVRALAVVARFEAQAPDGTPRNSYRIALKRILGREALTLLAPLTADAELGTDAGEIFARSGTDGTEVLLGLLADAETPRERKGYMMALKGNPHGRHQIVAMLGHQQWFVARNVAELAGEMRMEEAVDELGRLLGHGDQRVRKAAAIALAKIGTPAVTEPLLRALRDGAAEARAFIATLIGSAHADSFTNPIASQLESEEDPDVIRELCLALARIGTKDAVQAIERAKKQGGLFSRRSRAMKEAAELALSRVRR